jgi:hypothetical protein
MLTIEQRAEFDRTGIVKLEAAFTEAAAARMRDVVWNELSHRYGIARDDPSTWGLHAPNGLVSSRKSHAFDPILGPVLSEALDDLLGAGQWIRPKHHGQVLVTMPNAEHWRVPDRLWHTDVGYERPAVGVKHWAFFDTVEPGGGGTMQLAGSHRLLARFVGERRPDDREYKRVRDAFMKSHPWLKALGRPDEDPDRNHRFMDADVDIDGLSARVVELTGKPGDVYLTHLWVMQSAAPNASQRPRMMRSRVFSPVATD